MSSAVSVPVANRLTTLCFHGIGEPGRALEPGEERFWITPERYTEILDVIVSHSGPVELTFDDANASDHQFGLPGLLDRGLRAGFYVIAGRLDTPGSLSGSQLRELREVGMEVGSHGLDHLSWHEVPSEEFDREIGRAAEVISAVTSEPVIQAACPRGSYDRRVLTYLRRHGYQRVYTVDEGSSRPTAWLRNRYTVIHSDTAESIAARLERPDGAAARRLNRTVRQIVKRWR